MQAPPPQPPVIKTETVEPPKDNTGAKEEKKEEIKEEKPKKKKSKKQSDQKSTMHNIQDEGIIIVEEDEQETTGEKKEEQDPVSGTWAVEIKVSIEVGISGESFKQSFTIIGDADLTMNAEKSINGSFVVKEVQGEGPEEINEKAKNLNFTGKYDNGKVTLETSLEALGEGSGTLVLEGEVKDEKMSGTGKVTDMKEMSGGMDFKIDISWEGKRTGKQAGTNIQNNSKQPAQNNTAQTKPISHQTPPPVSQPTTSLLSVFDKNNAETIAQVPFYISDAVQVGSNEFVFAASMEKKIFRFGNNELAVIAQANNADKITRIINDNGIKILTSTQPAVFLVENSQNPTGEYVSKVIDAAKFVNWISINCGCSGQLSIETRTGNTNDPKEGGWSNWTNPIVGNYGKISSPPGKFIQFKVKFPDPSSYLERVTLTYSVFNNPPSVQNLMVQPVIQPGQPTRYMVQVMAQDLDGDIMDFEAMIKGVEEKDWVPLYDKPVNTPSLNINTQDLPDGKYHLKVIVSDRITNPVGYRTSTIVSPVFIVDNTPPTLEIRVERDSKIKITAIDNGSGLKQVSYRVNNSSSWEEVSPNDSLFDASREQVEIKLKGKLKEGVNIFIIRAIDQQNNFVIRHVEVNN